MKDVRGSTADRNDGELEHDAVDPLDVPMPRSEPQDPRHRRGNKVDERDVACWSANESPRFAATSPLATASRVPHTLKIRTFCVGEISSALVAMSR